jgi:hypothetical protein
MTEITRRHLLGLAGASAAGAAVCVCARRALAATQHPVTAAEHTPAVLPETARQHFVTRPDLQPPKIAVTQYGHVASSRYIFLDSPAAGPGTGGAVIINSKGDLIWFDPDSPGQNKMDVNAQMLNGEPVLTWFQGPIVLGHGEGQAYIADNTYTVQQTVSAQKALSGSGADGLKVDLHEFFITPNNTAIISAYNMHSGVDLSGIGGPSSGHIFSGVFQEIGLVGSQAGQLLFQWDSFPMVPISESQMPIGGFGNGSKADPFDYFHINSICLDTDGNYLVSSRHCWTIFKINSQTGDVMWRLGGKRSSFNVGPDAVFHWQHHVRRTSPGELTVFDNGAAGKTFETETRSRAMILNVNETTMEASLKRGFAYPLQNVLAWAMGSAQVLPDGDMFVDWGETARFSQFSAEGKLVLDGRMNKHAPSYRGFSQVWSGHPTTRPSVVAKPSSTGATVYASWNGSTEIASWVIWAGETSTSLARVTSAPRTGFETTIAVQNAGPYFMAVARDAKQNILRKSEVVQVS